MKMIVRWPAEVLEKPAAPVEDFSALEPLLTDMLAAVKDANGIGIAAPQIGVSLQVALVGRGDGSFLEVVNPQLLDWAGPKQLDEGCLSIPNQQAKCPRFQTVRVRYHDKAGNRYERTAHGQLAHIFQHEIDHLNGLVYVSRLAWHIQARIRKRALQQAAEAKGLL